MSEKCQKRVRTVYEQCNYPQHFCKKIPEMAPNGTRRIFSPTNPDLADILGDTDVDFENVYFSDFLWIPNFPISRFQISKFPEIWPGPGLGQLSQLQTEPLYPLLEKTLVDFISFTLLAYGKTKVISLLGC